MKGPRGRLLLKYLWRARGERLQAFAGVGYPDIWSHCLDHLGMLSKVRDREQDLQSTYGNLTRYEGKDASLCIC